MLDSPVHVLDKFYFIFSLPVVHTFSIDLYNVFVCIWFFGYICCWFSGKRLYKAALRILLWLCLHDIVNDVSWLLICPMLSFPAILYIIDSYIVALWFPMTIWSDFVTNSRQILFGWLVRFFETVNTAPLDYMLRCRVHYVLDSARLRGEYFSNPRDAKRRGDSEKYSAELSSNYSTPLPYCP